MKINITNNKQSFLFKPLKIIQSLGWVAVAILALPTVVGSYFAWKKLVSIWNKNERPDTKKADEIASGVFFEDEGDEDDLVIFEKTLQDKIALEDAEEGFATLDFDKTLDKDYVAKTPQEEKVELYQEAIRQFKTSDCLGSCSTEAYLDYLKNTEHDLGFHFNTSLLYNSGIDLDKFLTNIQEEIKTAEEKANKATVEIETATAEIKKAKRIKKAEEGIKKVQEEIMTAPLLERIKTAEKRIKRAEEEIKRAEKVKKTPLLIFVPFLLARDLFREQHIVVAVINKTNERIEYFDPKGKPYSIFADRNLVQWNIPSQKFLEKLSLSVFPNKEPSIIRNINGPQHVANRVDCGVHALSFIQTRMYTSFTPSNKVPNYFETALPSNGRQLRDIMAETLQNRIGKFDRFL